MLTQEQIKVAELFVLLNWLQVPLSYFLIDITPPKTPSGVAKQEKP